MLGAVKKVLKSGGIALQKGIEESTESGSSFLKYT